jgi:RNA methyltransferase, TrmH family
MTVSYLTGKNNPLLKTIRLMMSGSHRAPEQLVAAEGIRVLEEVNRAGCGIETVVCSEKFGVDVREKALLYEWLSKQIPICRTGEKLFQSISGVRTHQGAIALVRMPALSLNAIKPEPHALILCACEIQDPGNLGTLIRTAAAAGVNFICTTKGTVSARNPKALRSSAGAFFRLPVIEHVDPSDLHAYCDAHSIQPYQTNPREGIPYNKVDFSRACAVFLGNEGSGISPHAFAGFSSIHVPMADGVESLNVAMAGTVILFEAFRRRSHELKARINTK